MQSVLGAALATVQIGKVLDPYPPSQSLNHVPRQRDRGLACFAAERRALRSLPYTMAVHEPSICWCGRATEIRDVCPPERRR